MKLYNIFDSKAETYTAPYMALNEDVMKRNLLSATDSVWAKHPYDYSLFEIAAYDEVTGVITNYKAPRHICGMHELYAARRDDDQEGIQQ